jgi:hypothetical protein
VVFVVYTLRSMRSYTWDHADGRVGYCGTSGTHGTHPTTEYHCQVTWRADGVDHEAELDAHADTVPGSQIDLRVNGDQAMLDPNPWGLVLGFGFALFCFAIAGSALRRSRRR